MRTRRVALSDPTGGDRTARSWVPSRTTVCGVPVVLWELSCGESGLKRASPGGRGDVLGAASSGTDRPVSYPPLVCRAVAGQFSGDRRDGGGGS